MAQLRDIITGLKTDDKGGPKPLAFDLAGMAIGTVALNNIHTVGLNMHDSGDQTG